MRSLYCILMVAILWMQTSCGSNSPEAENKNTTTATENPKQAKTKTIVFFGNSLTAGYGLASTEEAFPAVIQDKIDSLKLTYSVVNAGVSGETTSGGVSRIDWILQQPLDIFVLELGANDGLRGIPVAQTKQNLQTIIDKVRAKYPAAKLVLAGMQVPPNMGQTYARSFAQIFPELAQENNCALVPFLLEGVGGEAALNQEDGIHPTAEGARILAQNVWDVMQPLL